MAYNFKNLADVELLSAMPETANVLVEVDGATKRAPQVDEIAKIVGSESLNEVPAGATVLAEVNGEIKRVPGEELGGKSMVVNLTMDIDSEAITADKTYEEIKLALREGRHVIGILTGDTPDGTTMSYTLNVFDSYIGFDKEFEGVIVFYAWAGKNELSAIKITSANTIMMSELLDIPAVTTSVADGYPAAVTSGAVYTALQAKQDVITDHVILSSSTADSTKRFKITVDDSGTLTATEVTA